MTSTEFSLCAIVGLANPGPVATALWTDAELEAGVSLDGIITVVVGRLGLHALRILLQMKVLLIARQFFHLLMPFGTSYGSTGRTALATAAVGSTC